MNESKNHVINLPNTLTAARILLVPFYIVSFLYDRFDLALGLFLVASVTDMLDGLIARLRNQYTRFGEILDPIADKVLLISSFIMLSMLHWVPIWLTVAVISRDLIVLTGTMILYLTSGVLTISVTFLGKLTTVFQVFQLAYILLLVNIRGEPGNPLVLTLAVFAVTVLSGVQYVMKGLKLASAS